MKLLTNIKQSILNIKETLHFTGTHASGIITLCAMGISNSLHRDNIRLLKAIYAIDPQWDRTHRIDMEGYLELILEIKLLGMDPRHLTKDIKALENEARQAQPIREIRKPAKPTAIKLTTKK